MVERRADRSGQVLGPYQLTRLLGAGGFGEVYEADHRLLRQKRAIKLLLERHFHDLNQRERFLREARTLATLEHPNILPVLEVGEEDTVLYLVMPFYHRGTLGDLLKPRTTPLPLAEIERYLTQMCAAVGYAHARHIAHLDLKPENMLLHEDGRLVLADFGLAHLIKQGRLEAGSSASWGTPYYMAPEHIRGEPQSGSDLYALGIILYQLLTNQRPFTGTTPEAVMMKHLLEAPPPLRAVSPMTPATLEPVIQKALEKQPENRYPTAEALLADFRMAVRSLSSPSVLPPAPVVPPAAPSPQMSSPAPVVPPTSIVPPEYVLHPAEPVNMTKATGGGCEIPLNNGYLCGIPPIGRCATCGRAFCPTHQAREYGSVPYVDMCAPCFALEEAEAVQRWKEAHPDYDSYVYFESGAARAALLASGVQPVEIYEIHRKFKAGLFGLPGRYVDVAFPVGSGWILGKFKWRRVFYGKDSAGEWVRGGDCLTALLNLPTDNVYYSEYSTCGLVAIRPCSRGYELLRGDMKENHQRAEDLDIWKEIAEAGKRLVGRSS